MFSVEVRCYTILSDVFSASVSLDPWLREALLLLMMRNILIAWHGAE